jgi:uroporphyrin-3 C-methyltransferase
MASLAQVMPVDIDVLAGQLVALTDQIDGLSVLESRVSGHEAAIAQAAQGVSAAEEDVAAATLALLRSIFVWRRPGEDQLPALPPQEEMVLRQNLRLFLEQARLALILRDDALLRASLQRATDWLETHFHTEAPAVAAMLAALQVLADSSLRPALPDISESLALARQLSGVAGN